MSKSHKSRPRRALQGGSSASTPPACHLHDSEPIFPETIYEIRDRFKIALINRFWEIGFEESVLRVFRVFPEPIYDFDVLTVAVGHSDRFSQRRFMILMCFPEHIYDFITELSSRAKNRVARFKNRLAKNRF